MKRIALIAALMLLSQIGWGRAITITDTDSAGTTTVTLDHQGELRDLPNVPNPTIYTLAWESSATSTVTTVFNMYGSIARVVTNPSATAPADNYDIVINDQDGLDMLQGKCANRDTANSEEVTPLIGDGTTTDKLVPVYGQVTLSITDAGVNKQGVIRIYMLR